MIKAKLHQEIIPLNYARHQESTIGCTKLLKNQLTRATKKCWTSSFKFLFSRVTSLRGRLLGIQFVIIEGSVTLSSVQYIVARSILVISQLSNIVEEGRVFTHCMPHPQLVGERICKKYKYPLPSKGDGWTLVYAYSYTFSLPY